MAGRAMYGGTRARRGCDPKKILRRVAQIIDSARLMRGQGIDAADLSINWAELIKHKHGFTDSVPRHMEAVLSANGVDTLHGQALLPTRTPSRSTTGPTRQHTS